MKTQKIITPKVAMTAIFAVAILTIISCSGKQGNPANDNSRSSDAITSSKPPGMDIHTATFMGDLKVIHQHINAGSDLNAKDEYGSSPLIIAATFGRTEVASVLIEAGADVNCTNNDGSTPLHTAAFLCRKEIVEALLDNGADKNMKNNFGSTALESVTGPFENAKTIYDQFSRDLGPLGFKLDYEYLEVTRPRIAEILR